jgi:hypothetical protein
MRVWEWAVRYQKHVLPISWIMWWLGVHWLPEGSVYLYCIIHQPCSHLGVGWDVHMVALNRKWVIMQLDMASALCAESLKLKMRVLACARWEWRRCYTWLAVHHNGHIWMSLLHAAYNKAGELIFDSVMCSVKLKLTMMWLLPNDSMCEGWLLHIVWRCPPSWRRCPSRQSGWLLCCWGPEIFAGPE